MNKAKTLSVLIPIAVIITIPILVFLNTLHNGFHLDDYYRVVDNPSIQKIIPVWRHFTDPGTMSTHATIREFRPLLPLTLSLNYVLNNNSLSAYHITNLLFQIIASILLYFLIRELRLHMPNENINSKSSKEWDTLALFTALIFAIHPVTGILINYICSRDLILMQMFLLASLLAYIRMRRLGFSWNRWFFVLLFFMLSILSKTNPIILPFIVLCFEIIIRNENPKKLKTYFPTISFFIIIVLFFVYRNFLNLSLFTTIVSKNTDSISYAITQTMIHVFHYIPHFFYPFKIVIDPHVELITITNAKALISISLILASLIWAWKIKIKNPIISFCIFTYWILMIPTSSIFPFHAYRVDYRPYASSPFFFLIIGIFMFTYIKTKQRIILYTILVIYFGMASFFMNKTWKTDETLWRHSVNHGGSGLAHLNLAMSLNNAQEKIQYLKKALDFNPNYILAHVNLGLALIRTGQKEKGLSHLNKAISIDPKKAQSHYWLGKAYKTLGMKREAVNSMETAAKLDPRNLKYSYEAAIELQSMDAFDRSLTAIENIVKINTSYKNTFFLKGFALWKTGKIDASIIEYQKFLKINHGHFQAHFNLAYALMDKGNFKPAITHFLKTLDIKPDYYEVHLHLSTCYRKTGNTERASLHETTYRSTQKKLQ